MRKKFNWKPPSKAQIWPAKRQMGFRCWALGHTWFWACYERDDGSWAHGGPLCIWCDVGWMGFFQEYGLMAWHPKPPRDCPCPPADEQPPREHMAGVIDWESVIAYERSKQ